MGSARKDPEWRTRKPMLGIRQLNHGFEQQAQQDVENGFQLRSRFIKILNVPERVRLRF
jgi:hypothetical protein